MMAIHKALPQEIDRLYVTRKEGGRGLASIEDCVDAIIQGHEDYSKTRKERLITVARNRIINGNILCTNRKTTIKNL